MLPAEPFLAQILARAIAPRKPLTVSQWADGHRVLSSKTSPESGRWRTNRTPYLREPMDCMSVRSTVQAIVCMFPIQSGKSEFETNTLGYIMNHAPAPVMVCLPGEVSMKKWINQKLNPLIEETPAVAEALTSTASRNAANQKDFKDFAGGQLYMEHAGSPQRLKQTTVRYLIVDELTEFANALKTGDDPLKMLEGRTSAYPHLKKHAYVSTPGVKGRCRTAELYERSDRRRYHVPCPHCGHHQPLEWGGLQWTVDHVGKVVHAAYVCRECGAFIEEHHKPDMLRDAAAGGTAHWVPDNPGAAIRGYHLNGLYYQIGLGPRWAALAQMWLDAQGDPAALKTFINDRLAEPWEDRALKAVRSNIIQDRAEDYPLRVAPHGVIWITAGIDTQDNRLEVQIVGWGLNRRSWTLDYAVLQGDPAHEEVWTALTDLLNRPIKHESGALLPVSAAAIDGRGHRTQFVKDYARRALVRRPMPIFGAKSANALPLSRPKLEDVDHRGKTAADSIHTWQVGTVAIKHTLYQRLAADAEKEDPAERWCHFPMALASHAENNPMPTFFGGLVSEIFDPVKGRYIPRKGSDRNEPLDTWVYAFAATQHPELALHRHTRAQWEEDEARIVQAAPAAAITQAQSAKTTPQPQPPRRRFARSTYLTRR